MTPCFIIQAQNQYLAQTILAESKRAVILTQLNLMNAFILVDSNK